MEHTGGLETSPPVGHNLDMAALLERHAGVFSGTNAFRLMPGDTPQNAPMRAEISHAAKGGLVQLDYTWAHPADGEQRGLLVFGPGDEPGSIAAFWGDSWHQSPAPRTLDGTLDGDSITVGYVYGGDWRWEIVIDAAVPEQVTLTMNNVIPASAAKPDLAAGPYAAMHAVLRPAG